MPKTETVTVEVPVELLAQVRGAVQTGDYPSDNDVFSDALLHWTESRVNNVEDVESLKKAWQEAIDDPRPHVPMDEVFARLKARYAVTEQPVAK